MSTQYDLRGISPTIAQILDVDVPSGAEVGPVQEVLQTLPEARRLALIVIDGFGSALWEFVKTSVPTLNRLALAHRIEIDSVLPSETYVCMASIFTGIAPGAHGVSNLDDMARAAEHLESLFHTVLRAEKKTLLAAHRKGVDGLPLDRLAHRALVVEDIYDDDIYVQLPDLIHSENPDFAFIHLTDIDEVGHRYGPYSEEVREAASRMDTRLANLLTHFCAGEYALLMMADHGLHTAPGGLDAEGHRGMHDGSVEEDRIVPLVWASPEELASCL